MDTGKLLTFGERYGVSTDTYKAQAIRPIVRGNRMLTARGRELILRRRRQNERDANGAYRWEQAKGYGMSAAEYLAATHEKKAPAYAPPVRGLRFGR